jgi:hypothetical protein
MGWSSEDQMLAQHYRDLLVTTMLGVLPTAVDCQNLVNRVRPGSWNEIAPISTSYANTVRMLVEAAYAQGWLRSLVSQLGELFTARPEFSSILVEFDRVASESADSDQIDVTPYTELPALSEASGMQMRPLRVLKPAKAPQMDPTLSTTRDAEPFEATRIASGELSLDPSNQQITEFDVTARLTFAGLMEVPIAKAGYVFAISNADLLLRALDGTFVPKSQYAPDLAAGNRDYYTIVSKGSIRGRNTECWAIRAPCRVSQRDWLADDVLRERGSNHGWKLLCKVQKKGTGDPAVDGFVFLSLRRSQFGSQDQKESEWSCRTIPRVREFESALPR